MFSEKRFEAKRAPRPAPAFAPARAPASAPCFPRSESLIRRRPPRQDHRYFVRGADEWLQLKISVSGFYSSFFEEFDAEAVSRLVVRKRRRDKKSPYYYLLQLHEEDEPAAQAVRTAWAALGERASAAGTRCHLAMELVANGEAPEVRAADEPLVAVATEWLDARRAEGWLPYRTEWSIFIDGARAGAKRDRAYNEAHPQLLAGQTDLLLRHVGSGAFWLVDYKFCGSDKLPREGASKGAFRRGRAPFSAVPDDSYGHYLCQQSVYAHMLRRRYGVKVSRASLLHVPTDASPAFAHALDLELLDAATVERAFRVFFEVPDAVPPGREEGGPGAAE